jgi:phosphatidylserine/phosphatidylglycerophosphate/cardiolipin synthase-like enzyme
LIKEDIEKGVTDLDKIRALKEAGAEIKYNNMLHAKLFIIDQNVAIISSANLTEKGLHANYEAGIRITDEKTLQEVIYFFNEAWRGSEEVTQKRIELCMNGELHQNLGKT